MSLGTVLTDNLHVIGDGSHLSLGTVLIDNLHAF